MFPFPLLIFHQSNILRTEPSDGDKTQLPRRQRHRRRGHHRYATPRAAGHRGARGGQAGAGEGAGGEAEDGRVHPVPAGGAQPRHEGAQEAQGARGRGGRRQRQDHRPGDRRGPPQLHRGREAAGAAGLLLRRHRSSCRGRAAEEEVRDVRRPADGRGGVPRAAVAGRRDGAAPRAAAALLPRAAVPEADVGRARGREGHG